jgi:hypothetical protein
MVSRISHKAIVRAHYLGCRKYITTDTLRSYLNTEDCIATKILIGNVVLFSNCTSIATFNDQGEKLFCTHGQWPPQVTDKVIFFFHEINRQDRHGDRYNCQ